MPRQVRVKAHYRSAPSRRKSSNSGCPTAILLFLLPIAGVLLALRLI